MFSADSAFFHLFSFLFIYFSSFVCILIGSDSTCYQHCINMNTQCKLISSLFHEQLNYLLAALNIIAYSVDDLTILTDLRCLFMDVVCHHHHHLHRSAAASTATTTNPFSSPVKFSCLISVLKGILDVFCYQICWFFLINIR